MEESVTGSLGVRSRTASINSQMYAIPVSEENEFQSSEGSSEDEDDNDEYHDNNDRYTNVCNDVDEEEDGDEESASDMLLDSIVPETSSNLLMNQLNTPMFDCSKYLFQSLSQALNAADFSEAIALQTRTSGLINSKSRELEKLSQEIQQKLQYFEARFAKGAQTSKRITRSLQYASKQVERINGVFQTRYPIEFNQAKEEIVERRSST